MARERKAPDFSPDELSQIEGIKQKVLDDPAPVSRPGNTTPVSGDKMPYYGFLNFAEGGKVAPNNRFGFATPNKYAKK